MKKYIIAMVSIVAFLVVFIPLASSNPDGLEKVIESFGAEEQAPIWEGFMKNYSVSLIGNSYSSTLIAGIVGTIVVFSSAILLSKTLTAKRKSSSPLKGHKP